MIPIFWELLLYLLRSEWVTSKRKEDKRGKTGYADAPLVRWQGGYIITLSSNKTPESNPQAWFNDLFD